MGYEMDGCCPRRTAEEMEPKFLSPLAAKSRDARASRLHEYHPDDFRTEFERDYTRILHSKAFRRLRHKTQVFISPRNDHLCTRIEHSLYVASISRTISKALRLNNELVAAISIGHDLGHAPFGHHGERVLDKIAKEHGINSGHFWHEQQSLRVVDLLEPGSDRPRDAAPSAPAGLNLTLPVRDGIACHYGENLERELRPDRLKKHVLLQRDRDKPCTLEGCVVRCADIISYLGRDLEDGMTVGLVKENLIPKIVRELLGTTNRTVIARLVHDLCRNRDDDTDAICFSQDVVQAAQQLKDFNNQHIYQSDIVRRHFGLLDYAIRMMFDELTQKVLKHADDLDGLKQNSSPTHVHVLHEFLTRDLGLASIAEKDAPIHVLDYIAGMTDNFFLDTFSEMFRADLEELFSVSHGLNHTISIPSVRIPTRP